MRDRSFHRQCRSMITVQCMCMGESERCGVQLGKEIPSLSISLFPTVHWTKTYVPSFPYGRVGRRFMYRWNEINDGICRKFIAKDKISVILMQDFFLYHLTLHITELWTFEHVVPILNSLTGHCAFNRNPFVSQAFTNCGFFPASFLPSLVGPVNRAWILFHPFNS